MPITTQPQKSDGGHLYVGASEMMKASSVGFDTSGFGSEDLRVIVDASAIVIAGGRPRGTLYGVYTFLEDCMGVRFLTPDHTHVPKHNASLVLKSMDKFYSPPLSYRFCGSGEIHEDHAFAVRMRSNGYFGDIDERLGGESPMELINHSFANYVPWDKYGKEHPEYFNEREGKRPTHTRTDHEDPGVQLCCTNPDVKRLIIEGVLKDLEKQPGRGNISVSQNDNRRFCTCPDCKKLDDAAGSNMGSVLQLVNEVADVVAEKHAGVLVGSLAYQYSRPPPVNIVPRPNVQIQLCSIECCIIHALNDPECERNTIFCSDLVGWGKITKNVYIWNYVANFRNHLLPCPLLRSLGPNIRLFVESNAKGIFMQGPELGANLGGLRSYVICNMLWDPSRDERQLIDEFANLHYGDQAHAVREYIRIIHDAAEGSGEHQGCFGTSRQYGITPDVARKALAVLEGAMEATDDALILERLEKATIGCYAVFMDPVTSLAYDKARAITDHVDDGSPFVLDPESALAARPHLAKLLELCRKHDVKRFTDTASMDSIEKVLREGYKLDEKEKF